MEPHSTMLAVISVLVVCLVLHLAMRTRRRL